ncbi:hypothetical protein DFH09DRAFT_462348 [Mycena vulgaris]|nr:hypothetical protein DFH09DRAFT_462348 [Mycena vulgaris]
MIFILSCAVFVNTDCRHTSRFIFDHLPAIIHPKPPVDAPSGTIRRAEDTETGSETGEVNTDHCTTYKRRPSRWPILYSSPHTHQLNTIQTCLPPTSRPGPVSPLVFSPPPSRTTPPYRQTQTPNFVAALSCPRSKLGSAPSPSRTTPLFIRTPTPSSVRPVVLSEAQKQHPPRLPPLAPGNASRRSLLRMLVPAPPALHPNQPPPRVPTTPARKRTVISIA